jgi:PRC-barrel domain
MLMSDLLRRSVVDADGVSLGKVRDVRVVQDGPYIEGFGNALRVDALVVGRGAIAVRLGYTRVGVRGPWLLRVGSTALEGRAYLVPWTEVEDHDDQLVTHRRRADLQHVRDAATD